MTTKSWETRKRLYKNGFTDECRKKMSLARTGKPPWNKGKSMTEEYKRNISEVMMNLWANPEYREKQSKIIYGNDRPRHSPKIGTIEKIRLARAKQILPTKDTEIEHIVQNYLKGKIDFITHFSITLPDGRSHQADIFIPSKKLVVECDGTYWHSLSYRREFDKYLDRKLPTMGYAVLRLPEKSIRNGSFKSMLSGILF